MEIGGIFVSLRFYVKSISVIFVDLKLAFLFILEALIDFDQCLHFLRAETALGKLKFRASKTFKMTLFERL